MKNQKKLNTVKLFFFSLFTLLLTACGDILNPDFNTEVRGFFEKYTETAAVEEEELDGTYPVNSSGITCLDSNQDHTITFILRNPQLYTLEPIYSPTNTEFNYDFVQDSSDKSILKLTISQSQLESLDQSTNKDISGTISMREALSGRIFDAYQLKLHVNSPPPAVLSPVFQLDSESNGQYIVCMYFPLTQSMPLHSSDTRVFYINGSKKYFSGSTIYDSASYDEESDSWTYSDANSDFTTSTPTLFPLIEGGFEFGKDSDGNAVSAPSNYTALYYTTGISPTTDTVSYTFTIEDDDGLSSSVAISNKASQLNPPTFYVESSNSYGADEDTGLYALKITHDGLCTDGSSSGSVTINYTITETEGASVFNNGSASSITSSSAGSATIYLPQGTYTVTATASKNYYITSEEVTKTSVKITQSAVFYVSQNGSDDSNTGKRASPYRTINKAIAVFRDGLGSNLYESDAECIIYVMSDLTPPDDFTGNTFINIPTISNSIQIIGYGAVRTIDAKGNSSNSRRLLYAPLSSGAKLTIKNINLKGGYIDGDSLDAAVHFYCDFEMIGGSITGCTAESKNVIKVTVGTGLFDGVTISGNKVSTEDNSVLYIAGSLTLKDSSIINNTAENSAVYLSTVGSLTVSGKVNIYNSKKSDGTAASNLYMPTGSVITVGGNISGSKIGVNVPWQQGDEDAPKVGVPVAFTSGYGYGTTNSSLPGEIFIAENGYGISTDSSGEAAFAVSGGGMYTALDYDVSMTSSSVKAVLNKAKTVTVAVSGTRKEPSGATTYLYYNNANGKFYTDPDLTAKAAGDNNTVEFAAALYNGATKVSDCEVAAASETGKILVTVPALAFEDTYTIRVTSTFLGVTKDVNVEYVVSSALTPDGAISAIQGMSGGSLYVAVAGTITSSQLSQIKDAINTAYSNYSTTRISLDLSGCTGLSGQFLSFNGCKGLSEIILPEGITSLGVECFRDCSNLTDVYLPASLSSIADLAFLYCSADLTVSKDSLYYMREGDALYSKDGKTLVMYCNKLEENSTFTVPARVEKIGAWAFGQAKIKTISFESNSIMKTVGQHAFDRCRQLISIEFPDSIETIGNYCFQYNTNLANVKLPASLTVVPQSMFGYSAAFTSIVIPDGVTEIQYAAFWGIDTLQTIVLPASLQTVVYGAFNYCDELTTVNYKGSEEQKAAMTIETNQNTALINATWTYNYTD